MYFLKEQGKSQRMARDNWLLKNVTYMCHFEDEYNRNEGLRGEYKTWGDKMPSFCRTYFLKTSALNRSLFVTHGYESYVWFVTLRAVWFGGYSVWKCKCIRDKHLIIKRENRFISPDSHRHRNLSTHRLTSCHLLTALWRYGQHFQTPVQSLGNSPHWYIDHTYRPAEITSNYFFIPSVGPVKASLWSSEAAGLKDEVLV